MSAAMTDLEQPDRPERKRPANFDNRYPPEMRLDLMEQMQELLDKGDNTTWFRSQHNIPTFSFQNWRSALRDGTLVPDPEKHPRLFARQQAFTERKKKPAKKANKSKTARKIPQAETTPQAPAKIVADLMKNIGLIEKENTDMRSALIEIRDLINSVL